MSQKQHYIPKVYLKGFLDPKSLGITNLEPYLWYSENNKEARKSAPSNILWQKKIYTQYENESQENNSLETFFSKFLENPFKQFKQKFENDLLNLNITELKRKKIEDERILISSFIFWQWKRTKKFIDEVKISFERELLQDNEEILVKEYMSSIKFNNDIMGLIINLGNKHEDKNALEIISKKNMIFTVIKNDFTNFIGSDNPVIITNANGPNGIIYPETELSMPLTSKIAVTFIGNNSTTSIRKVNDKKIIRQINRSIVKNSSEIFFGTNKAQLDNLRTILQK